MVCAEDRLVVVRAKRVKALQVRVELRGDILEIDFRIDVDHCTCLLRKDIVGYIFFEALGELFHIFCLHRKAGCIGVTTEVFQQVATIFDGLVHIESRYGASRTGCQIVGASQYHRRAIVDFGKARCHDTDNPLVPFFVEDNDGTAFGQVFEFFHNLVGFLGHGLVQVLAGFVVLVDLVGLLQCGRKVLFHQ